MSYGNCKDCVYFQDTFENKRDVGPLGGPKKIIVEIVGTCRRYAPRPDGTDGRPALWPKVNEALGCGEFESKVKPAPYVPPKPRGIG